MKVSGHLSAAIATLYELHMTPLTPTRWVSRGGWAHEVGAPDSDAKLARAIEAAVEGSNTLDRQICTGENCQAFGPK